MLTARKLHHKKCYPQQLFLDEVMYVGVHMHMTQIELNWYHIQTMYSLINNGGLIASFTKSIRLFREDTKKTTANEIISLSKIEYDVRPTYQEIHWITNHPVNFNGMWRCIIIFNHNGSEKRGSNNVLIISILWWNGLDGITIVHCLSKLKKLLCTKIMFSRIYLQVVQQLGNVKWRIN